jgi:GNAT superfamily N-acetyltransferase
MITTRILKTYDEQAQYINESLKPFIPFLSVSLMGFRTVVVALENNVVVGIASLTEESSWHADCLGVGYVSTHKHYRDQGVATALAKAIFQYAHDIGKGISNTKYEPDGIMYLQKVMTRLATEYKNVKFIERT